MGKAYPKVSEEQYVDWLVKLTELREEFLDIYCDVMNAHSKSNRYTKKFDTNARRVDVGLIEVKWYLANLGDEAHDCVDVVSLADD
jgi:hypothetical protein